MFTLDCSTRDQALLSLSAGFGCTVPELSAVLLSLDLEQIFETDPSISVDACQYLREYVCEKLGTPRPFTSAYWFHGTRTFAGNAFPEGLLALNHSEALAMEMLITHAPNTEIRKRLQAWNYPGGVPDEMFELRTGDSIHWGPYGYLVREVLFHASDLGQHDYVRMPELVEDVCNAWSQKYNQDLTEHYLRVLHPCIVWFRANIEHESGTLEAALRYAYTSVRALEPDFGAVMGIDCNGESVPANAIVKVEFLPGTISNSVTWR